jgi:acetylornithine deacetylase
MPATPPPLLNMIGALVAVPSVSSVRPEFDQSNTGVVDLLAGWLETLGFRIDIQPVSGHLKKTNLIATLGQGPVGLVLSGHTDTVPWDESGWNSHPFTLTERDQRLHGLGTADMKAFFALTIEAIRALDPGTLERALVILATADEESTMSGARALAETGQPPGPCALIGEPTGLRPVRMHKGVSMEAIRLTGRSGHSSDPSLGNNALDGMHLVLDELVTWRSELQQVHRNVLFAVPFPTLNLGHIHGGDNPNRICAECELHIDMRPLPGMDLEELRGEMARRIRQRLADTGLKVRIESLIPGTPAMDTPADAAIVQAVERLTGHPAGAVAFGTEGPWFNRLGMQTVVLGPGDIDQAHQPNEYIAVNRLQPMIELLKSLVGEFCSKASE